MPLQSDNVIVKVEIWDLSLPVTRTYVQCTCICAQLVLLMTAQCSRLLATQSLISRIEAIFPFITFWDDVWMKLKLFYQQIMQSLFGLPFSPQGAEY